MQVKKSEKIADVIYGWPLTCIPSLLADKDSYLLLRFRWQFEKAPLPVGEDHIGQSHKDPRQGKFAARPL